jgi:uroporphyrinogen decarboxylase
MYKMTSNERFKRMFEHKEADRVPITDGPWAETIERWNREGMPEGMDFVDYFDLDHYTRLSVDNSPRYEEKVIEETDEYSIYTSSWGVTMKKFKHRSTTPEFLDYTIKSPDSCKKAKERMFPSKDRINWDYLAKNYKMWLEKGYWKEATIWFGFDVTHSWAVGTENLLIAMMEEPEWVCDMFNHYLEVDLALWDMVWDAGYTFDGMFWYDDMGYKGTQFFSLDMYRKMLKPFHKRAIEWAHKKGITTHLHSCGNIIDVMEDIIGIARIDAKHSNEDQIAPFSFWVDRYGDRIGNFGGVDTGDLCLKNEREIKDIVRDVMRYSTPHGGFALGSGNSIPDYVPVEGYLAMIEAAREFRGE